jgi:DnaJ-class molecular chaperone
VTLEEVLGGTTRTVVVEDGSQKRVEVKIPPGIREGSRVRAAGEGAASSGGQRGDLFLQVHVLPHPRLERKGDDLQTSVTVPLTTAVLGGEVEVPTLEGPVGIKVPPESRVGRVLRLRGRGLPRLETPGERGDLLAVLTVEMPRELTGKEREIFEELRRLGR